MKSIFNKEEYNSIMARIDKLTPQNQRLWGKMDVAQMLAHCVEPIRAALGEITLKKNLIVMLFKGAIKKAITTEKQFSKNSPTAREYIVTDSRNFEKEKEKLKSYITKFHNVGAAAFDNKEHPIVGKLTSDEWGLSVYKHLDYHLGQFGA